MVPDGWHELALEKVVSTSITYGVVQPGEADDGGVPFVRGGDFPNGRVLIDRLRTISPAISAAYKRTVLRGDELLVSLVGYPGATAIVPNALIGANIARQAALVRPNNAADRVYLFHFLSSQIGQKRMLAKSLGSAQQVINLRDLKEVAVLLPPLPKQKKIAEILSTWDKAIETTDKLLANAEAQKRALMQQLLTGKRRLKGFEGSLRPKVRFGDVVRLSKDRLDPVAKHNAMACVELEHLESKTGRLVGSTSSDQQASIKTVFRPGDVLFGKLRPYLQKFLMPDFEGACSTEIWALRPDPSKLTSAYLLALVQTPEFLAEANRSSGSKMPRADWSVVSKFRFSLPPVDEQNAIGEIATDCDREVADLLASKAALELEKRALMQQLLTGKRRVTV